MVVDEHQGLPQGLGGTPPAEVRKAWSYRLSLPESKRLSLMFTL